MLNQLLQQSFLLWLLEYWRISSGERKGEKYSFKYHKYLLEIAKDTHPYLCIRKSAQCGISELMIAQMFYYQDTSRGNTLYVFPASTQMEDFVAGRVRPAIEGSSHLRGSITEDYNLQRIKFKDFFIYFRGAQNTRQLRSIDASRLYLDEVDEMPPETIAALEKRLDASQWPIRRDFSTPSLPDFGIDSIYNQSDQREWHLRCEHCGTLQPLRWEENTTNTGSEEEPNIITICRRCHRPLDRLSDGQWIAATSADVHGYWISKLFFPLADLNKIYKDLQNPLKEQAAYNFDLGLPHQPKGSQLTDEILDGCRGSHRLMYKSNTSTSMGVDVGKKLHLRISRKDAQNRRICIYAGTCSWEELPNYISRYRVASCVIDAQPDTTKAEELYNTFKYIVKLAYYPSGLRELYIRKGHRISINRTQAMSLVLESYLNGSNLLPSDIRTVPEFYEQMKTPIKATRQDDKGNIVTYFPRSSKPDHYFHADVYDLIASDIGPSRVTVIRGLF